MTTSIYDQHAASFRDVSAYVLMLDNQNCGNISFKFGDSTVKCYVHIFGETMVCGKASGYGYDKASAAFQDAARKLAKVIATYSDEDKAKWPAQTAQALALIEASKTADSRGWCDSLRDVQMTVLRAI